MAHILRIWFDILTPKQVLFFDPFIKRLQKNHTVLCTSRSYREVVQLAKLCNLGVHFVGKHGGATKLGKLQSSLDRMKKLTKLVSRFGPDVAVSFSSPEAARVAFGLQIYHVGFSDSPHADAVMRLFVPFVQKLLIPWIIPKKEFTKYGIFSKNVIQYKAVDAAVIAKAFKMQKQGGRKILIRVEEAEAAYLKKQTPTSNIIQKAASAFGDSVIVLPRYNSQLVSLKEKFGKKIHVVDRVVPSNMILQDVGVFIGSGGTMTAEAALRGIPTISYNAVPNLVQDYLVKKKLIILQPNPERIILTAKKLLAQDNTTLEKKAKKTLEMMEDPYEKLVKIIKTV